MKKHKCTGDVKNIVSIHGAIEIEDVNNIDFDRYYFTYICETCGKKERWSNSWSYKIKGNKVILFCSDECREEYNRRELA